MAPKIPNLIGKKFGRWLVIEKAESDKYHNSCWKCRCICGHEKIVKSKNLLNGQSKSCGCYGVEYHRKRWTVHGQWGTNRWDLWNNAKHRAKIREVPFTIKIEDIPNIPERCPILDIKLERGKGIGGATPNSPSLDRINPVLGYIPGNLQIISLKANLIKQDATAEEVMKVAEYMRR